MNSIVVNPSESTKQCWVYYPHKSLLILKYQYMYMTSKSLFGLRGNHWHVAGSECQAVQRKMRCTGDSAPRHGCLELRTGFQPLHASTPFRT